MSVQRVGFPFEGFLVQNDMLSSQRRGGLWRRSWASFQTVDLCYLLLGTQWEAVKALCCLMNE